MPRTWLATAHLQSFCFQTHTRCRVYVSVIVPSSLERWNLYITGGLARNARVGEQHTRQALPAKSSKAIQYTVQQDRKDNFGPEKGRLLPDEARKRSRGQFRPSSHSSWGGALPGCWAGHLPERW